MSRRLPLNGLAVRFSLLLVAALIAANLVALAVLYVDNVARANDVRIEREVERIVSLVPALEAAPPERRDEAVREASTRVSQLSVGTSPIVENLPDAPRSRALTEELQEALGTREVRAAIMVRLGEDGRSLRGETVALSILLQGEPPQWLNSVSREDGRPPPGIPEDELFLALGISLAAVLGVALLFVRRLTRPLADLADAARAAGQGDRTARVQENGPEEVRAAARAFNEMQGRIEAFDAERMRTLAAVGHDLRTPITSLRIRAEMLDEVEGAPMIRTLDEMTVMADGLVAYARGAGQAEELSAVELSALVERLCEERGAELVAVEPAQVTGRPVALGRAIGNVIDNALRHGGAARVTLRKEQGAVLTIDDNGAGIPEAKLAEVFEPFVRGEESRNRDTGGAGLGLSIARTIITAHGGEIAIRNRAAGGLSVTIRLPLAGAGRQ